jgi:hypothetical protein
MDLVMQHGLVNAAWIWTMDMHGCRNANKKLSPASLVFLYLQLLGRHWHSGIMVSPARLVTD